MHRTLRMCLVAFVIIAACDFSLALPRFASRTGAKCQSCHVNPTGAEMRQTFGVQYGREQLPLPALSKDFEVEDFSNLLTNVLGVGADVRTLYFYQQRDSTSDNAFFQMQGDIYLNFKVAKKVTVFLNKGLRSGFEVFGLLNVLPASGHVKIGKFIPAFGTRIDDHTTYIRAKTGFSPELGRPELTGAEVGVLPGPLTIIGGMYNATDDFGAATTSNKAFLGRAEGMFNLAEHVNLGLGANIFSRKTPAGFTTSLIGGLGSFSYGDVTVFGEADLIKNNGTSGVTGLVAYVEGNVMVTQGVDLKVAYDFYDPDKDLKTGAISRYTVGFEFFPIAGVEVRPLYRIVKIEPVQTKANEFDLIVHFYM
jgi:hypothetical protein